MNATFTKPDLNLQMAHGLAAGFQFGLPVELAVSDSDTEKAPEWIQFFPKGPDLKTEDGRKFKLSDVDALAAKLNGRERPLMIDYDHKSHFMPEDGGDQTAAGWVERFEVRDGILFAQVRWTQTARNKIENLEYRYISPEFLAHRKTGEISDVIAAALVNRPAFVMQALASARAKHSSKEEKKPMLKQIATALGLPEDASEAQILAAIEKTNADHKAELAAAHAKAKTPSVDDFMPRADYDAVMARAVAAEKKLEDAESKAFMEKVETAIASAVEAGKITPASKEHYLSLCTDESTLTKVLEAVGASPEIGKGSGIEGKPPDESAVLTAAQKNMASSLGVPEEDFLKTRNASAA